MRSNDVIRQFVQRKRGWIESRIPLVGQLRFKLLGDGLDGNSLSFASFSEGPASLAAKIDAMILKNAGPSRPFGNQFANRSIGEWSSRRRNINRFVTHKIKNKGSLILRSPSAKHFHADTPILATG
jgi:hypothetical protein